MHRHPCNQQVHVDTFSVSYLISALPVVRCSTLVSATSLVSGYWLFSHLGLFTSLWSQVALISRPLHSRFEDPSLLERVARLRELVTAILCSPAGPLMQQLCWLVHTPRERPLPNSEESKIFPRHAAESLSDCLVLPVNDRFSSVQLNISIRSPRTWRLGSGPKQQIPTAEASKESQSRSWKAQGV